MPTLYRHPVLPGATPVARLCAHSNGAALVAYAWGSSSRLYSAGAADNTIMVYSV